MTSPLEVLPVPSVKRLLLIKPSSLGDIIHALPTLEALRRRFPKAEISWLVKAQWADILSRVDGLDRVWPVGRGLAAWLAEIGRLRQYGFDLVVDLQGLFRSGAAAWLTGCPVRIGFANAREGSPLCYSHRVAVPSPEMHAVDRYLLIARELGCPVAPPVFRLVPLAADRQMVHTLLAKAGLPDGPGWVAMQVAARWETKRWPLESFIALARRLRQEGIAVVVIGAPAEEAEAALVAKESGAVSIAGQTSLTLLPALLESAACLVTNDSGPMHVAAAMGTPVIALFGPTSPVRTGPYGAGHRVLARGLSCQPCLSRTCHNPLTMDCLRGIDPESVAREVVACLATVSASERT